MIMKAVDQAESYNPYRGCITVPSRCILDRRATTPKEQFRKKEPEWLYERVKNRQDTSIQEDGSKGKDVLQEEARNMRLFAKGFGQGVRQQRVCYNTGVRNTHSTNELVLF